MAAFLTATGSSYIWAAFAIGLVLMLLVGKLFVLPAKLLFKFIYNGILGGIMLWSVNLLGSHLAFNVTINPLTALVAGFLGIPGVVLVILFQLFTAP